MRDVDAYLRLPKVYLASIVRAYGASFAVSTNKLHRVDNWLVTLVMPDGTQRNILAEHCRLVRRIKRAR